MGPGRTSMSEATGEDEGVASFLEDAEDDLMIPVSLRRRDRGGTFACAEEADSEAALRAAGFIEPVELKR